MKFSYTLDSALKQACLKIDHNQYIVGWANSSSVDPEQNHKKERDLCVVQEEQKWQPMQIVQLRASSGRFLSTPK